MFYRAFGDKSLSALGMGTMRLPVIDGDEGKPDLQAVCEMVDRALARGINYFDTAWGYHNGQSEIVMGKALSRHPRDSFYLADKFPGYDLANIDKVDEIFEKQLEKCGVEYFDFYLVHNVCDTNIDAYTDPQLGIVNRLLERKKAGQIRHLGFSVHANQADFERFLKCHGEHMEFCQVQLNYLDWTFQDARSKVELLNELNIPVFVMEPLRGGRLVNLSDADRSLLTQLRPSESMHGWAFRFLESVPGVTVVLSGMSSLAQLDDNCDIFTSPAPLTRHEYDTLLELADRMQKATGVPCTSCRYCTEYCPQGLDIPHLLSLYNEHVFTGGGFMAPMAIEAMAEAARPSACVSCRGCEAVCPQGIKISETFEDFLKRLK
ncbi:MAG: oxidoreductase [Ruminococcaceae bacterium]|nr:oxidoreductase [Oscillospiraceae bacterium]